MDRDPLWLKCRGSGDDFSGYSWEKWICVEKAQWQWQLRCLNSYFSLSCSPTASTYLPSLAHSFASSSSLLLPPWPLVVNQFRSGRIFSLFSTIGIYSYLLCIYRCWINPWKFRWTTRIVLLLLLLYPDFQIKVEAV